MDLSGSDLTWSVCQFSDLFGTRWHFDRLEG